MLPFLGPQIHTHTHPLPAGQPEEPHPMAAKPCCGSGMIAVKQDRAPGATKFIFLLLET